MKKILAIVISSLLLFSTMAFTVSADTANVTGGNSGDGGADVSNSELETVTFDTGKMTFTTTLNMSSTAITAPNVTFTYTLSAIASVENTANPQYSVTSGVLPTTADYTASFTTADFKDSTGCVTEKITIDFTTAEYTSEGIYGYKIVATANVDSGIIMDTNTIRYIYVYVEDGDTIDDNFVVSEIIMYSAKAYATDTTDDESTDTVALKSAGFVNSYGVVANGNNNNQPGDANGTATNDFIVTAIADGLGADHNKEFTYTLTSDSSSIDEGTIFEVTTDSGTVYIKYNSTDNKFYVVTTSDSGVTYEQAEGASSVFTLCSTDSYTIHSVVEGMSFTATITDETGYTMTNREYGSDEDWDISTNDFDGTSVIPEPATTTVTTGLEFLTYYDLAIPDTGVILQYLPFVLLGVLALGFVSFKVYRLSAKK